MHTIPLCTSNSAHGCVHSYASDMLENGTSHCLVHAWNIRLLCICILMVHGKQDMPWYLVVLRGSCAENVWLCAGMLNALKACEEHPTVLVQLEDMRTDLVRFTYKLYAMLGQVGVYHLQMPPKKVLDAEFGANLKPKHRTESTSSRGVTLSKNQVCFQRVESDAWYH